jgi:uncharacterized Zn-finger protein
METSPPKIEDSETIGGNIRRGSRKKQQATLRFRFVGFNCSFCPKTWQSAYALRRHENSHTGNKPFSCIECIQTFSQEANLKVHFESVHANIKYSCPICFDMLSSVANLNHHVTLTHAEFLQTYCDKCNTWMRGDLSRHQATTLCTKNGEIEKKNRTDRLNSVLLTIEEDEAVNAMCGF